MATHKQDPILSPLGTVHHLPERIVPYGDGMPDREEVPTVYLPPELLQRVEELRENGATELTINAYIRGETFMKAMRQRHQALEEPNETPPHDNDNVVDIESKRKHKRRLLPRMRFLGSAALVFHVAFRKHGDDFDDIA